MHPEHKAIVVVLLGNALYLSLRLGAVVPSPLMGGERLGPVGFAADVIAVYGLSAILFFLLWLTIAKVRLRLSTVVAISAAPLLVGLAPYVAVERLFMYLSAGGTTSVIVFAIGMLTRLAAPVRVVPLTCANCKYSLIGNTSGRCPECGQGL